MPSLTLNGNAAGADNISHIRSFWARHEHLRDNETLRTVLLEDVITRYENLVNTHADYVAHHQNELEQSLALQQAQNNVRHLQNLLNRDPYLLVLIEGDGMIFNTIEDGEAGGKVAATTLQNAILDWATTSNNVLECPPDVKVVVRVYLNLKGLGEACAKAGLISSPAVLEEFARGFTRGKTMFDVVDVGYGKDRADVKIAENFKLFLHDYHCRQIVLGCSHDNGFARLLEQYTESQEAQMRVTLMKGVPFEKELTVLPFRTVKFDRIFRDLKTVVNTPDLLTGISPRRDSHALSGASSAFTPRSITPITPRYATPASNGMSQLDGVSGHLRSMSLTSSNSESGGSTWATLAKARADRPLTDLRKMSSPADVQDLGPPNLRKSSISRNRAGQRIDDSFDYDRDEVQYLKKMKMCNQHYIGMGCCHYNAGKPDKCPHKHDIKLNKHQLYCLRVVARETPCKKGLYCADTTCIYGHRCPFPRASEGSMRGSDRCLNGELCRFGADMHGVDTKVVKMTRATGRF
ncbi:hypothetical protein LTR78_000365 [Recurvomyces mirabilis]|uniref:C3H1-type domain-containing protein n=1 Tax=Recurvomyces mirabilis TaxID=574656 RepID=A0AAE0WXV7_9PEZI|nr:hypothetical protein LTR78_000365 [Recurvomyces mirabilis]KAK5162020.1 hypothetical protein LTS14_000366 [Recurvomyces mirabilis]